MKSSGTPAFETAAELGGRRLAPDEVHVWCADLRASNDLAAKLEQLMCPQEIARADRFRFPELRSRFVASRGLLRVLLSKYSGIPARNIEFALGHRGKPALADATMLRFNLAHSGDYSYYALGYKRELGVDLEQHRDLPDQGEVARRFFAPAEISDLLTLPAADRPAAFFRCWARKEAFVKATGDGLFTPLDSFCVSLLPLEPAALLAVPNKHQTRNWALQDVPAPDGYSAALAVEHGPARLTCALASAAEIVTRSGLDA